MPGIHKYFHWLYYSRNKGTLFIIGSGLFVWLFLAVTQPFGIFNSNIPEVLLFFMLLPIGIFWIVNLVAVDFISIRLLKSSPETNLEADFNLWMIKLISFIHLVFIIRGLLCDWQCVNVFEYSQLWLAVVILFAFCYFPFALYARSIFFQDIVIDGVQDESEITIPGGGNEKLRFKINEVAYFQADDNYIDVFLVDQKSSLRKVPIRSTLKMLEEQLSGYSQFMRIHRSYMVNIGFFTAFSKGNNMLSIRYGDSLVELPVSRKHKTAVSKLVTNPK